ncbi:MAG TPA: protein kinase [Fibrobacteria bacterium]|nr:protein kinase [Fibrobacteria bacterium]
MQAADGLRAADQMGVIHRDLKPANLLLHQDGVLKIADFGIAHWADHSTTRTGAVLGSQFYMSPEQAEGKKLSIQSDMFALGTVAYQCLTGEVPFPGDSQPSVARKICFEPHVPLAVRRPDLDPALVHVVETLLRKDPVQRGGGPGWARNVLLELLHHQGVLDPQERIRRYVQELSAEGLQTTGSFDRTKIRLLEAGLKQAQSRSRSVPPPTRHTRQGRRRGRLALTAGGVALAACLGAGAWVFSGGAARPDAARKTPTDPPSARIRDAFPAPVQPRAVPALVEPSAPVVVAPVASPKQPAKEKSTQAPARPPGVRVERRAATLVEPVEEGETSLSIISSPPFAEVYLDGSYLSTAPVRDHRMRSGRHRVRLEWTNGEMGVLDTLLVLQPGRQSHRFFLPGFREAP